MNTKHTPLPWVFAYGAIYRDLPNLQAENSGIRIAQMDRNEPHTTPVERDANAAYIVKAVNAHDELVGALEHFEEYASQVLRDHIRDLGETERNKAYHDAIRKDIEQARSALALAKQTTNRS